LIAGCLLMLAVVPALASDVGTADAALHRDAEFVATVAWWMGAQEYPHAALDTVGRIADDELRMVKERSLRAVAGMLDVGADGSRVVGCNPLGFARTTVASAGTLPAAADWCVMGPDGAPAPMELQPLPGDSTRVDVRFLAALPPHGFVTYTVRPLLWDDPPPRPLPALDVAPQGCDSLTTATRRRLLDRHPPAFMPLSSAPDVAGPWGRSFCFVRVGNDQGPHHGQAAVTGLRKLPGRDWVEVELTNQSNAPAAAVILAPVAPVQLWQERQQDGAQIVAGNDVDVRGGALVCDLAAGQRRWFAVQLAPPPEARMGLVGR
jgi:hypothetical protein